VAADGCGRGFLVAYAVPILNPDLPSWLVELYRSLSWSPGVLHHRLRVRIFLADERLRYLVRDWDDRDCPTSGPAAAASRLIPLLSVLNWRVRIRPRRRVAIYMAGWPGRDLCGRVAGSRSMWPGFRVIRRIGCYWEQQVGQPALLTLSRTASVVGRAVMGLPGPGLSTPIVHWTSLGPLDSRWRSAPCGWSGLCRSCFCSLASLNFGH
jgi:hypothetical protein